MKGELIEEKIMDEVYIELIGGKKKEIGMKMERGYDGGESRGNGREKVVMEERNRKLKKRI